MTADKPRHRLLAGITHILQELATRLEAAQQDNQEVLVAAKILTGHEDEIAAGLKQVRIENPCAGLLVLLEKWVNEAKSLMTTSASLDDPNLREQLDARIELIFEHSNELSAELAKSQAQFGTLLDSLGIDKEPSSSDSGDQAGPAPSEGPGQREAS